MSKYSKYLYNPTKISGGGENELLDEGVIGNFKEKLGKLKNKLLNRNKSTMSWKSKLGIAAAGAGTGIAAGLLAKNFAKKPQPKIIETTREVDFSELPPDIQAKFANKQ